MGISNINLNKKDIMSTLDIQKHLAVQADYSFSEVLWAYLVGSVMFTIFLIVYPFLYADSLFWSSVLSPVLLFLEPTLILWAWADSSSFDNLLKYSNPYLTYPIKAVIDSTIYQYFGVFLLLDLAYGPSIQSTSKVWPLLMI